MPDITMSIPTEAINAFADGVGYSATLPDGRPNPQSRGQFARAYLVRLVRETVVNYDYRQKVAAIQRREPPVITLK